MHLRAMRRILTLRKNFIGCIVTVQSSFVKSARPG